MIVNNINNKNPKSTRGLTVLHCAAQAGNFDICKLVIGNTDDKNPKHDNGTTPLDVAIKEGHESVVRLLKSFDNSLHSNI